jgi:aminoglycoside 3-N-acetyltransferase
MMFLPEHIRIEKSKLEEDFKKLGIVKGDHVAVALSFKSIGIIENGPDTLIDSLLEVIGPEGTLMMNAHTNSFPLSEVSRDYLFDPSLTIPNTGIVPRTMLKRKNAIRSRHPTCSVVALGKLSKYLTDEHDEYSQPYLPFNKLAQVGGKLLCIGIDGRLVALRHEAQRMAGLFIVPEFWGVLYKTLKGEVKLFAWQLPPCTKRLPELVPLLEKAGIINRGYIGKAASVVGPVNELLEAMSSMLKVDPTLNLCYDYSCLNCREIERRLNLYGKIGNPKFFQKSLLVRLVLSYRNKLVLRRYSHFSFQSSGRKSKIHPDFVLESGIRRLLWIFSKILK